MKVRCIGAVADSDFYIGVALICAALGSGWCFLASLSIAVLSGIMHDISEKFEKGNEKCK